LERGGRITLGILGVGADGHVASLFHEQDVQRGAGKYAIPVPREVPPNRVSVTQALLQKAEALVLMVAGPEKAAIVETLMSHAESIIAGQVTQGVPQIELWYSNE